LQESAAMLAYPCTGNDHFIAANGFIQRTFSQEKPVLRAFQQFLSVRIVDDNHGSAHIYVEFLVDTPEIRQRNIRDAGQPFKLAIAAGWAYV